MGQIRFELKGAIFLIFCHAQGWLSHKHFCDHFNKWLCGYIIIQIFDISIWLFKLKINSNRPIYMLTGRTCRLKIQLLKKIVTMQKSKLLCLTFKSQNHSKLSHFWNFPVFRSVYIDGSIFDLIYKSMSNYSLTTM